MKEICSILRLPYEQIRVEHIVQILEKKPKEHDALEEVYLRLAKNSVMDPQTSNYGRTAYEEQGITGATGFDAKQ